MAMIQLSTWQFVVIMQLMIVLASTCLFLFLLYRRKLTAQSGISVENRKENLDEDKSDPRQYLLQEQKISLGRKEALGYGEEEQENRRNEEERLLLNLRADILHNELQLVSLKHRDEHYWSTLIKGLREVLEKHDLYSRFSLMFDDEVRDVRQIMDKQLKAFKYIHEHIGKSDDENIKEKIDAMMRSHKELSFCVLTLEDQTHFLREQISALLQH